MALIDTYGLAALYELRRSDAGFPSVPSHSPMSFASLSSRSPSPPDEAQLPLSSTQPEFKTPERKRGVSHSASVLDIIPLSIGSIMRRTQEAGADQVGKFTRADYDGYIREDLGSRVFVDFDAFIKSVLCIPEDWRSAWGSTVEAVKADSDFKRHHEYCCKCNDSDAAEKPSYPFLIETANAAIGVLSRFASNDTPPGVSQYHHTNDPKRLRGGVINMPNPSPDIVVSHKD